MQLRLYNTRSRDIEPVEFRDDGFSMYVCGPTVYDKPHIGNARPVIVFDSLMRVIRSIVPKHIPLIHASNITDIDDKIIVRAEELGVSISELTEGTTAHYLECLAGLGINPVIQPRATKSIPEMILMISRLIEGGFAYEAEGHVLFDISQGEMTFQHGGDSDHSRIEAATYKRNPADFVLWKPEWKSVGWDSPWGSGRPGWHIECSAMIHEHLGDTIDIHGGGQDLIFPHHEAECQQSHAMTGQPLARLWMHVGMVMIDGRKMSKSDGNFITIDEVLSRPQGGDAMRLSMLMTHYRQPYDFTHQRINEAQSILNHAFDRANAVTEESRFVSHGSDGVTVLSQGHGGPELLEKTISRYEGKIDEPFLNALLNDFNTPLAIQRLSNMSRHDILPSLALLGFFPPEADVLDSEAQSIFDERCEARRNGDWELSDILRHDLSTMGVLVEDTGKKSRWKRMRPAVFP